MDVKILEGFERPKEMPKVFLDDTGVIVYDFKTNLVNIDSIMFAHYDQFKICPDPLPVLVQCEGVNNLNDEIIAIAASDFVVDMTAATAIVVTQKLGETQKEIFNEKNTNPYPTKFFNTEKNAREWLAQFVK